MSFVYHRVPPRTVGTVLYPLNELHAVSPEWHAFSMARYEGREKLTQTRIPALNCRWNDVLFLTAVHPVAFRKAFESAGYQRQEPFRAYQFDARALNTGKTAVLTKMGIDQPLQCERFDPTRLDEYATIPEATLNYWRERHALGDTRPFLFLHIPHILYRGTLDITFATIVEA